MAFRRLTTTLLTVPLLMGIVCCQSAAAAGPESVPPAATGGSHVDGSPDGQSRTVDGGLIVLIVIDQLRADLMDRYDGVFTGGLRRLLDRGRVYTNATHDHALTETSPGHASISTGTYPSRHGLVSNQWYQTIDGSQQIVYNVVHEAYAEVGDQLAGAGAPVRLEREALADWMVGHDGDTKVLSVSAKDRSAVLLGGKGKNPVFWFSSYQGRFVTSTFYGDDLPDWVDRFNTSVLPAFLTGDSVWASSVPAEIAGMSRPDTAAGEGDGVHTWFPHLRPVPADSAPAPWPGSWLESIPSLDRATIELAKVGLEELELGDDDVPDLLAIGLSQTDRVGHAYGPYSREQFDNLLRLDLLLGEFFGYLDDALGPDGYGVAFSADHGALELPESRAEQGLVGRRLTLDDQQRLGEILGEAVRGSGTNDLARLAPIIADAAPDVDWIEQAWTNVELAAGGVSDSITTLFQRSTFPGRGPGPLGRYGVTIQLSPGMVDWGTPLGTSHGTVYHYDRHVPLIFMGPGVTPGRSVTRVGTVDIAPTLAAWFGIPTPNDLDGHPIRESGMPTGAADGPAAGGSSP